WILSVHARQDRLQHAAGSPDRLSSPRIRAAGAGRSSGRPSHRRHEPDAAPSQIGPRAAARGRESPDRRANARWPRECGDTYQATVCTSNQTLSAAMITATTQARLRIHRGATNGPIFALSLVNITSGNTANDSCKLRIT